MSRPRIRVALVVLNLVMTSPGFLSVGDAEATPPAPPGAQTGAQPSEATPARVSYINGEVSFWRPGAQDWTPATLNTPLAPGDVLYTGSSGNVEIQAGPRAFVRAAEGTQIGLDNHEPDFIQFRVTAGRAAVDLRELAPGHTVELDTPNAALTIERTGYYRADVAQDATTFTAHRGGTATMTPAGGTATLIPANQQLVVTGTNAPAVATGPAPALTAWDRWNYQRTDYLVQPANTRYVAPAVYGGETLNQYGSWRTVETYGNVWVPAGVPPGWVPYSTGRWIWDPRFGWTWLDTAPWGWAPYHYGRWVFVGDYWAWTPGLVVVRPVYAPALVVFLGGVVVGVDRPLCWAPLGWGEPVIPWWGGPGFVGVAWWGGWGGPRVVNNVVVKQTTTINVTNITIYKHVNVTHAVVGVPADRFGQGKVQLTRISRAQVQQLTPVRGALQVKPMAASMMPASGAAIKPPVAIQARGVVATRRPHDFTPTLRQHGLTATAATVPEAAAPKLVPPPRHLATSAKGTGAPAAGLGRSPSAAPGPASPVTGGQAPRKDRPVVKAERGQRHAPAPASPAPETMPPRHAPPPPPPTAQDGASQHGREKPRPVPRANRSTAPPVRGERPDLAKPPIRADGPEQGAPPRRNERPEQR